MSKTLWVVLLTSLFNVAHAQTSKLNLNCVQNQPAGDEIQILIELYSSRVDGALQMKAFYQKGGGHIADGALFVAPASANQNSPVYGITYTSVLGSVVMYKNGNSFSCAYGKCDGLGQVFMPFLSFSFRCNRY